MLKKAVSSLPHGIDFFYVFCWITQLFDTPRLTEYSFRIKSSDFKSDKIWGHKRFGRYFAVKKTGILDSERENLVKKTGILDSELEILVKNTVNSRKSSEKKCEF